MKKVTTESTESTEKGLSIPWHFSVLPVLSVVEFRKGYEGFAFNNSGNEEVT